MLVSKIFKGTALAVAIFTANAAQAQEVSLPKTMVWTSYDLGSSGYVEASAMADALDKKFGTTIRLTPSGTAIGRMLPLTKKRANFGFMSNEIFFASEAMFEFAAQDWGPQDLRVLLGRPAAVGLVTGLDTGISTLSDVKGRKVGFVQANPSTLMNTKAALAFAGLSVGDVEEVIYPGYGAMMKAFTAGEIDVVPALPTSSSLREAEGGRGVRWLDMPATDTAGWARVQQSSSVFSPSTMTVGVSISESDPAELLGYRYPQLTAYADVSEDEVYNLVKALDESFDLYKDANKVMNRWVMKDSGTTPAGAPFHKGAVKYLTEIGVWDSEDEAWNTARLARLDAVKSAWSKALEMAKANKVSDDDWATFWEDYRVKALN